MSRLKSLVNNPAPDFELPDQDSRTVRLSSLRGSPVILFFYPQDDTTGCTKEACAFRDRYSEFEECRIFGISSDSAESHRRFIEKFSLPYSLLTDADGRVRRLYGVRRTFGIIPGRATIVIDATGIVRHVYSSQFLPERHVVEALFQVNSLNPE